MVPRKTPKEEQTKLVTDKTSPAVKEDNSKMPNSNRNTQLVKVEVHVYIHQSIPNSNRTEVSISITDLGACINNALNLSLTPLRARAPA